MMLIKCNIYLAKHADCGNNPGLRSFFVYIDILIFWEEVSLKEEMQYQLNYVESDTDDIDAGRNKADDTAQRSDTKSTLFWSFPRGRGRFQPWRRRLWELQNNSDRE